MGLLERLQFVIENNFERITYSEAIAILKDSKPNKKKKFKHIIDGFGSDLQSEHERYLVEKKFKKPVIIIDYPKEICVTNTTKKAGKNCPITKKKF